MGLWWNDDTNEVLQDMGACRQLLRVSLWSWREEDVFDIGKQVNDLKYSNDGQQFLVISGTIQAKLFDREGEEKYVQSIFFQDRIA